MHLTRAAASLYHAVRGDRWMPPFEARLDRPGWRWLLTALRSVEQSCCMSRRVRVAYRECQWVSRYDDGTVTLLGFEPPELLDAKAADLFLHHYSLRPDDVVVDAGAGPGTELLAFARRVGPKGRVVAIEAHPRAIAELDAMQKLNRLACVTLTHAALTLEPGTAVITDDPLGASNTIVDHDAAGREVPASTLDDVLERLGIVEVDLLKMNIEGAELMALRGFSRLASVRHVVIACHDYRAAEGRGSDAMRTNAAVRSLLEEAGFDIFSRDDDPRPWVRDYVYGRRCECTYPPNGTR